LGSTFAALVWLRVSGLGPTMDLNRSENFKKRVVR
jgi:hypothetical protein